MLHTRFSKMFGLRYRVMSAPMTMRSGASIAAAVSPAGALGSFGGMNPKGPDWLTAEVAAIRAQADRPFAVDFITPFLELAKPLFDGQREFCVPGHRHCSADGPAATAGLTDHILTGVNSGSTMDSGDPPEKEPR